MHDVCAASLLNRNTFHGCLNSLDNAIRSMGLLRSHLSDHRDLCRISPFQVVGGNATFFGVGLLSLPSEKVFLEPGQYDQASEASCHFWPCPLCPPLGRFCFFMRVLSFWMRAENEALHTAAAQA